LNSRVISFLTGVRGLDWIWIATGIGLIVNIAVMLSFIHCKVCVERTGDNDSLFVQIRALFGFIRYRYDIPVIDYKGVFGGVEIFSERINENKGENLNDQHRKLTPSSLKRNFGKFKRLLEHANGLTEWIKGSMSHVHCTKLRWQTYLGVGGADDTAVVTGFIWGVKSTLLAFLSKRIRLETRPHIEVNPLFNRSLFSMNLLCIVKIRFGYAIIAGLLLAVRILTAKGGLKTWRNILFRA
jgi:hypothetical protein